MATPAKQRLSSPHSKRCGDGTPSSSLTVLQDSPGQIRRSRSVWWRASVLGIVQLAIAGHVIHYLTAGRTVSPLEPSEAMYTLELGSINAGFLAFVVMLGSTAIFGRFFCGWGCHVVAIQDFSLYALRRIGVRPKPVRARLLVWGPTVVAGYMFVWPTFSRVLTGGSVIPPGGFRVSLWTTDLWATFPHLAMALLTFVVCGFVAVLLLGPKGFCTYGCPYGALFGPLGRYAPLRIIASDACQQCGHCTAACTSNVRVHAEVRDFGMVVDANCMKCLDCVSVCPNDALHVQWGSPFPSRENSSSARSPRVAKTYDYTIREEIAAGIVWICATLALRGLYDGPPLLLSVAVGALTAFLALVTWHVMIGTTFQVLRVPLRRNGRLTKRAIACFGGLVAWTLFLGHSGFVQWERYRGRHFLSLTEISWDRLRVLQGPSLATSASHQRNIEQARRAFEAADRWGLMGVVEIKLGLAWCALLNGETARAEGFLKAAKSVRPDVPDVYDRLIEFYQWRGNEGAAASIMHEKMQHVPSDRIKSL
jgi:polyferredoxin